MMPDQYNHWTMNRDPSNLVWIKLDVAQSSTNILSRSVLSEFRLILDQLAIETLAGVAVISGKSKGFIAGADIREFTGISDAKQALETIREGQMIMDKLDQLPCPTVAAIDGFCVGGGLELALACDYRIATDSPDTRLGLPEVKLGIHPGYGGTVRILRHVNALAAMDLMLTGRNINAKRAKKIGLIDHVVPRRQLENAARMLLLDRPSKHRVSKIETLLNSSLARPVIAARIRKRISSKTLPDHYPAPYAITDLWVKHYGKEAGMQQHEARSVANLSVTGTSKNLVRTFMLSKKLKSLASREFTHMRHVHVIGAGLMGSDIAAWCVQKGLMVTLQDIREESLAKARMRAWRYLKKRLVNRLSVKNAMDRFIPDLHGNGLSKADLVIEAVFENLETKQNLFSLIESSVKSGALLATNTSSIEIERLCDSLSQPERLVGMHFFNPVTKMPLVEVINGANTDPDILHRMISFTRQIDKLPLPVKSSPGFLVNRILMPYIIEAGLIRETGTSVADIDQAATSFGMPMGPLELADTVGLDIGLHVAESLDIAYGFGVPELLRTMVQAGKLGRKSGQGFYTWKQGKKIKHGRRSPSSNIETIQNRLMFRLINEAVACLRENIVEDRDLLDAGVVFGTGFAPFRGGPMQYINSENPATLLETLSALQNQFGDRFKPDAGWLELCSESVSEG